MCSSVGRTPLLSPYLGQCSQCCKHKRTQFPRQTPIICLNLSPAERLLGQSLDEHPAPVDLSSCSVSSPTFFFLNHCSDSNVCKLDLVAITDPEDEQVKGWQANFGSWLQFGIAGSIFPCWKACLQQRRLWGLLIFKPEHHPVGQMMSFGLDFYFSDLFDHFNILIFENVYSDDLPISNHFCSWIFYVV